MMHLDYSPERCGPRAAFLEMVDRNCRRLMRAGGGQLPREMPHYGKLVPEAEQAEWLRLARDGMSGNAIAQRRGWAQTTVARYLRKFRASGKLTQPIAA